MSFRISQLIRLVAFLHQFIYFRFRSSFILENSTLPKKKGKPKVTEIGG
jgi:hypothetical protein